MARDIFQANINIHSKTLSFSTCAEKTAFGKQVARLLAITTLLR
jgi:hypothetical protein